MPRLVCTTEHFVCKMTIKQDSRFEVESSQSSRHKMFSIIVVSSPTRCFSPLLPHVLLPPVFAPASCSVPTRVNTTYSCPAGPASLSGKSFSTAAGFHLTSFPLIVCFTVSHSFFVSPECVHHFFFCVPDCE